MDKTVGSWVWWHTRGSSKRPALDLGWGSSSKTALGSLSTGSSLRRRLDVQSGLRKGGKVLWLPAQAQPSVIVDTEKVLLEADGPVEGSTKKLVSGGKEFALGAPVPEKAARSPKNTSGARTRTHCCHTF